MHNSIILKKNSPPFFFNPSTWLYLIAFLAPLGQIPKYYGIEFSIVKILVVLAIFLGIAEKAVKRDLISRTPLDFYMLFFVLSFIPSFAWTSEPSYLVAVILTIAGYMVLNILAVNFIVSKDTLLKIVITLIVSTFIVSILGIIQFQTGKTFLDVTGRETLYSWGETRVLLGTEKNPNAFASHFVVAFPLVFSLFLAFKKGSAKILLGICILVFLIPLFLTLSRGAIVGVAAGIIIISLFFILKKNQKMLISFLFIMIFFSIALISFWQSFPEYSPVAIFGNESDAAIHVKISSSQERLILMNANIQIFLDNPFLGVGFGNSVYETIRYGCSRPLSPHSNILGIACEVGVIGIVPFLLVIFVYTKILLKSIKITNDPLLFGLSVGLFASYMAQHIFGLTHMNFISVSLWLVTGLSLAGVEIAEREH